MKPFALLVAVLAFSQTAIAAESAYLFATFKDEQSPMGEQIYFALSQDGLQWEALNKAEPVLVSDVGTKGVRDPYLIRSRDGEKTYLIATDLSVNRINHNWPRAVDSGSRSVVIWESEDLVNWSEPRLVPVAPEDTGCAWAPEAVYDEAKGDFLLFWASTTAGDDFSKHRIWTRRTKDFRTFGEPFIYIEKPTAVIDPTIVNANDRYYRFTKDEADKGMIMEKSPSVGGPWEPIPDSSLSQISGYEGPLCFQLAPDSGGAAPWMLLLDRYSQGTGYHAFLSEDLASGQFTPAPRFETPFQFRHGTVLPITAEERQRLQAAYGVAP